MSLVENLQCGVMIRIRKFHIRDTIGPNGNPGGREILGFVYPADGYISSTPQPKGRGNGRSRDFFFFLPLSLSRSLLPRHKQITTDWPAASAGTLQMNGEKGGTGGRQ